MCLKVVLPVAGVAPFVWEAFQQPTTERKIAHLAVVALVVAAIWLMLRGVFLVMETLERRRWTRQWRAGMRVEFTDNNGDERTAEVVAVRPEQRCLVVRFQDAEGATRERPIFSGRGRVVGGSVSVRVVRSARAG